VTSTVKVVSSAAALCLLTWSLQTSLQAADGVLVTEKSTTAGKTDIHQIQVEKTRIRADVTGPNGEPMVVIFDGVKQVLWMLDLNAKTYSELTKADADGMAGQRAGVAAQMQEAMRGMSPAERAQMEAMMRGRGMPAAIAAPSQTEYRRVAADKVGKWACTKYDGYQGSQKTAEVCAIDPKNMGFAVADFAVATQMADLLVKLVPQAADATFRLGTGDAGGYSGVPVRRVFSIAGQETTSEMTDAARQTFLESTFAVPADFTKSASPSGRGQ
jgi:hypothetical protein